MERINKYPKSTKQEKIKFLFENFPDVTKKDPYRDHVWIRNIRESMLQHGLYSQSYGQCTANMDSAIIKLIASIQKSSTKNR